MYYISLFLVLSQIVMLRWRWYAIVPIVVAGLTRSIAACNGFDYQYVLMYTVGNLFSIVSIFLIYRYKENITSSYYLILFVLTGYFGYCFGQSLLGSIIFNKNFIDLFISIVTVESLNAVISMIVIWIASKQKGLLEEQKTYIIKTQQEEN